MKTLKDNLHRIVNGRVVAVNLPKPKKISKEEREKLEKVQKQLEYIISRRL